MEPVLTVSNKRYQSFSVKKPVEPIDTITEASPPKQESLPAKQESLPAKQESLPAKQESLPAKQESLPAKQESLPAKQESLPAAHPEAAEKVDVVVLAQTLSSHSKEFGRVCEQLVAEYRQAVQTQNSNDIWGALMHEKCKTLVGHAKVLTTKIMEDLRVVAKATRESSFLNCSRDIEAILENRLKLLLEIQ